MTDKLKHWAQSLYYATVGPKTDVPVWETTSGQQLTRYFNNEEAAQKGVREAQSLGYTSATSEKKLHLFKVVYSK